MIPWAISLIKKNACFSYAATLFLDTKKERYTGGIEIIVQDTINLSAIGILTTKLPDGTKGISLLIIVAFGPPTPIHIAYNFFLAGVGGILGLHRTLDTDALRGGLEQGTIDDILFPTNILVNAERIVKNLNSVFPPKKDQFVIGPMVLITWNTPPLLRAEVGIIIELGTPVKIAIIGLGR